MSNQAEDVCAVCARWPPALRPTMRQAIDNIPLKQPACDDCVIAFWDKFWTDAVARRKEAKQLRP
jgi:hypothetical protein